MTSLGHGIWGRRRSGEAAKRRGGGVARPGRSPGWWAAAGASPSFLHEPSPKSGACLGRDNGQLQGTCLHIHLQTDDKAKGRTVKRPGGLLDDEGRILSRLLLLLTSSFCSESITLGHWSHAPCSQQTRLHQALVSKRSIYVCQLSVLEFQTRSHPAMPKQSTFHPSHFNSPWLACIKEERASKWESSKTASKETDGGQRYVATNRLESKDACK